MVTIAVIHTKTNHYARFTVMTIALIQTANLSDQNKTRAGVYKTLCPQHLLVPKYGQICSVVIPQKNLDFAQTFNR